MRGEDWCSSLSIEIIISVAENQISIAQNLHRVKATIYLGHYNEVTSRDVYLAIESILLHPDKLAQLSENSLIISGVHGAEKVCETIFSEIQ